MQAERRRQTREMASILKRDLNIEQQHALNMLEKFGWCLKFVRHYPPRPPIGVLCDPVKHTYAILDEFGALQENPASASFR